VPKTLLDESKISKKKRQTRHEKTVSAVFTPCGPEFILKAFHAGFMVDKVEPKQYLRLNSSGGSLGLSF
jgi:hypothetical protein